MKKSGIQKIENWEKLGRADIHIHSCYSDGRPKIKDILDYVQEKTDLNVIAICDHDTIEGALEAKEQMKKGNYRFDLIVGEEITSTKGHILGLFLKEKVRPGMSPEKTIEAIHSQGGLVVASHPFERTRWHNQNLPTMDGIGLKELIKNADDLDGLEIVNATPGLADENYKASLVNKTIIFTAETGGSDAHILEAIGMGFTLFEGKTSQDFRKALKYHQTRAMFAKWTVMALVKYLFFFIPLGFRIIINTIINGRAKMSE